MVLSPLPYRFRETCKLIKRDIKNFFRKTHSEDKDTFQQRISKLDSLQQRITALPVRRRPSVSTAYTTLSQHGSSQRPETGTTATEYSDANILPSYEHVEVLRASWYKQRPRDVAEDERWLTRGIAIVLAIALCYWPAQNETGHKALEAAADLHLAVTDRSRTRELVEAVLGQVLPGVDVTEFLIHVGDPAQRLADNESELLHQKFCELLMPEDAVSGGADIGFRRELA